MESIKLIDHWWGLRMRIGRLMRAHTSKQHGTAIRGRDRIIGIIAHDGPDLSQRQLADRVHMKPGSLTEALGHLEDEGYVTRTRDEKDRRILRVNLTAKGKQQNAKNLKNQRQFVENLLAGIDPADLAATNRVLTQMIDNFDRNYGEATPPKKGAK